jgi:hypothetical protein
VVFVTCNELSLTLLSIVNVITIVLCQCSICGKLTLAHSKEAISEPPLSRGQSTYAFFSLHWIPTDGA